MSADAGSPSSNLVIVSNSSLSSIDAVYVIEPTVTDVSEPLNDAIVKTLFDVNPPGYAPL